MPWNFKTMSALTAVEWAYIAGILDGEGCLGVYLRGRNHKGSRQKTPSRNFRPRIQVANTDLRLMMWLREKLGGTLYGKTPPGNRKIIYVWNCQSTPACQAVCQGVLPYLVIKKEQAQLILEFPADVKANQYTPSLTERSYQQKARLYAMTLRLNQTGLKKAVNE